MALGDFKFSTEADDEEFLVRMTTEGGTSRYGGKMRDLKEELGIDIDAQGTFEFSIYKDDPDTGSSYFRVPHEQMLEFHAWLTERLYG